MEKKESKDENNKDAKFLLNLKNHMLKAKRITTVESDEIKENIRLKLCNNTEDHTKGMNGDKIDTNDKEHQQKRPRKNSTGLGKTENNKHTGAEGEQYAVSNKLREDLNIMWHKVRLLQTS